MIPASGDELVLGFDAAALLLVAEGWGRSVFLETSRWDTDADINNLEANRRPQGHDPAHVIGQAPDAAPVVPWFDAPRAKAGVEFVNGLGLFESDVLGGGVAIDDVDGDGWADLPLARDPGACVYRRQHGGSLQLRADAIPDPTEHRGAVGATLADHKGDLDALVVNRVHSITVGNVATSRFHNHGGARFTDVTEVLDVQRFTTSSYLATRADDDDSPGGLLDRHDAVLHNMGGGFELVEPSLIEYRDAASRRNEGRARRAGAVGRNLDGCFDALVMHLDGQPAYPHDCCDPGRHGLGLRLVGSRSDRDAVGAVAMLDTGGARQRQAEVAGTRSLMPSCWNVLCFGLDRVERIEERWPSGAVDTHHDVDASRHYTVESAGVARPGLGPS